MGIMDREYMQERQRAVLEELTGAHRRRGRRARSRTGGLWHGPGRLPRMATVLLWLTVLLVAATLALMVRDWSHRRPFPPAPQMRWHADVQASPATLILSTPARGPLYWVSLHDWQGDQLVASVALRPGERVETGFPLGRYRLRVATGQVWQGEARQFGLLTQRRVAVQPLDFTHDAGHWQGVRVDLDQALTSHLELRRSW